MLYAVPFMKWHAIIKLGDYLDMQKAAFAKAGYSRPSLEACHLLMPLPNSMEMAEWPGVCIEMKPLQLHILSLASCSQVL